MHLLFFVRGIYHEVEVWKMFMQTQMFPWKRKRLIDVKTGKKLKKPVEELTGVQGALRVAPWGYEYVFPKECLAEVLTMMGLADPKMKSKNYKGIRQWGLRYIIGKGVKPVPPMKPVNTSHFIPSRGVAVYAIGIKEDPIGELLGYEQEML